MLALLNDDFLQVHRSFCVNKNFIEGFSTNLQTVKINKAELPIGRINREKVKEYLGDVFFDKSK